MLNELLSAMRSYASERRKEVSRGLCSGEFAVILIQSYTESMIDALKILGREKEILQIRAESDRLCSIF